MKIFHPDKNEKPESRSRKQNGNAERSALPLSFWVWIELGRSVIDAGQTLTRHRASPLDHLAGDDEFLNAFL